MPSQSMFFYHSVLILFYMGFDITIWVEEKVISTLGTEWKALLDVSRLIGRNYDCFGILGSGHNGLEHLQIASLKGLPSDLSRELTELDELTDLTANFGYTWYNLEELQAYDWDQQLDEDIVRRTHAKTVRELMSPGFWDILALLKQLTDNGRALRVILWFSH